MNKITYQRGSIVSPSYLNEIQESIKFTASPRTEYYSEPDESESSLWQINYRDGLKGWEIDSRGALGAAAHSGRVMGVSGATIVYGPPSTTSYPPVTDSEGALSPVLDSSQTLPSGTYGIIIESGSIIGTDGSSQSWPRTYIEVSAGSQIYIIFHSALSELQAIETLPSRGEPFVALAYLDIAVDGSFSEILDLRSVSKVDSLYNYTKNFVNTELVSSDKVAATWERVMVDATNGSIVITLPSDANDGDEIVVVDALNEVSKDNNIILRPDPSILLQNSSSDWVISEPGAIVELYFLQEFNSWRFKSGLKNFCDPEPGEFLQCGGSLDAGITLPENCPNGKPLPADSRYGVSLGVYSYDSATMRCTKVLNPGTAVYSSGKEPPEPEYNFGLYSTRCGVRQTLDTATNSTVYGDPNNIPQLTYDPSTSTVIGITTVPIFNDVPAGTYGDSDRSAKITIDSKGRIETVEEVEIFPNTENITSGTYGGTNAIPKITVDSKGRITGIIQQQLEIPLLSLPINDNITPETYGDRNSIPVITVTNQGLVDQISVASIFNDVPAGTYGDSDRSAKITIDSKGRIETVEEVEIFPNTENITSGTYGGTNAIPKITVDSKGRITGIIQQQLEIPQLSLPINDNITPETYGDRDSVPVITVTNQGLVDQISVASIFNDVPAGTYGGTNLIPVITVDSKGRITGITQQQLQNPPSAAINDLEFYVDDANGSDINGTGTSIDPVKTVQQAILLASKLTYTANTKAKIYIRSGTYTTRFIIPKKISASIEIIGETSNPDDVVLTGETENTYFSLLETEGASDHIFFCESECRIRDVTFRAGTTRNACFVQNGGSLHLDNCVIDGAKNGIIAAPQSYVKIYNTLEVKGTYTESLFVNLGGTLEIFGIADPLSLYLPNTFTTNLIRGTRGGFTLIQNVKFMNLSVSAVENLLFYDVDLDSALAIDTIKDGSDNLVQNFTGTASNNGKVYVYY